jgi:ATP-dependent DNA ligase
MSKKRTGIMLCYPFDEKRLNKWKPPYIIQPKLDGIRCRAVFNGENWTLLTSESNIILSAPHINEDLKKFYPHHLSIELDGEIYNHEMSFEEINSRVSRTVNAHENFIGLQFHVFDIISDEIQTLRLLELNKLKDQEFIKKVPYYVAENLEEILKIYESILDLKYEGIIIRHFSNMYVRKRSTLIMKFKPKKSDFYKIVGFNEEISIKGERKNRLGALVCSSDGGVEFCVGSGLNDELREYYWKNRDKLIGNICHVQYQHTTPGKGVPRFPVYISIVNAQLERIDEI